ncbi:Oidioi.mRNA.OKI2018_I69.chr2.g5117.t1.cds [Oikopleura dioica]|uniref:Oidioi.mRNA.OKI2018_I69.chr2.g5117.t1.cds n=1 Tax=Oikopleura dioica TaxID=34765 RepID=A0ABN7T2S0_OIKDI|nr:Oidioi.mRNA.OKI2018_I69.chr2.g5117.t1.cds [Oikopleura dioica]
MLGFLAVLSVFIHFRTFFMMPYGMPGKEWAEGNFLRSNIVSKCQKVGENSEIKEEKSEKNEPEKEKIPLKESCLNQTFLLFATVFVVYSTRVKALQGWIYPWMEWSYAKVPGDTAEIEAHVGNLLEIYGLLLFASPLFAALPELFSWIGSKLNRNGILNGDMISLTIIMSYSAIACSVCSGQMMYRAKDLDDNANAYALIVIFSIAKTIVYAAPNMFLFYMFPPEHFGSLYGILTAPGIVTMWFIDPLFRLILGDSESLADADFAPVSIGFAVLCGVGLIQVFLPKIGLIPAAKRMCREKQNQSERTKEESHGIDNNGFELEKSEDMF